MMDSQENTLQQGKVEDDQKTVEATSEVQNEQADNATPCEQPATMCSCEQSKTSCSCETDEKEEACNSDACCCVAEEPTKKTYSSKKEVLERVKEISSSNEKPDKAEVDLLKSVFYKLHTAEREQQQKEYLQAGGDPDKYQVTPDADEEAFKAEMQKIKEKRAEIIREQEAEKERNLQAKLEIIEKIKDMATSPEAANNSFNEFKALQQQFKEYKAVPAEKANEVWRNYQLYVEKFYDLLNLNREAREYDFKKNLEQKTKLCEEAEKLDEETDVISAFHQLQELHAQYREIGPVAKELRDEIWSRFKAASVVINKKHQQHFEALRAKEEENLEKKTALCEKAEAVANAQKKTAHDWEKGTKEIIAIQQEWKTIGFAPQKMNVKIFERFRAICDDFFNRKAEFFKTMKEEYAVNIEKKKELVEKAKELSDSTDWKSTSDKLIALQKEWKTIGTVPKKIGDQLWNEFLNACNHFFEARKAAHAGINNEQQENLSKKKEIIEQLRTFLDSTEEEVHDQVQKLVDEYNKIGHVPFKEKDKLYKAYHEVLDKVYEKLHMSVTRRKLHNFKSNLKNIAKRGEEAVDNERGRLMRRYEQLKQEITTYENNIGFLSISSKKGNSLVDEMKRKVEKLKNDASLVREKIKTIDLQNKEEKTEEEA